MPEPSARQSDHPGLPVAAAPATSRPSLARSAPSAAFVSQLIAARDRLHPQRARHAETNRGAVGAYGIAARMAERRMPLGYRKTVLA